MKCPLCTNLLGLTRLNIETAHRLGESRDQLGLDNLWRNLHTAQHSNSGDRILIESGILTLADLQLMARNRDSSLEPPEMRECVDDHVSDHLDDNPISSWGRTTQMVYENHRAGVCDCDSEIADEECVEMGIVREDELEPLDQEQPATPEVPRAGAQLYEHCNDIGPTSTKPTVDMADASTDSGDDEPGTPLGQKPLMETVLAQAHHEINSALWQNGITWATSVAIMRPVSNLIDAVDSARWFCVRTNCRNRRGNARQDGLCDVCGDKFDRV